MAAMIQNSSVSERPQPVSQALTPDNLAVEAARPNQWCVHALHLIVCKFEQLMKQSRVRD
jgi:hypothetical protein